jgi:hypothetical protein
MLERASRVRISPPPHLKNPPFDGVIFLCGGEEVPCGTSVRDEKDFSLTSHRVRKVPADVIGESLLLRKVPAARVPIDTNTPLVHYQQRSILLKKEGAMAFHGDNDDGFGNDDDFPLEDPESVTIEDTLDQPIPMQEVSIRKRCWRTFAAHEHRVREYARRIVERRLPQSKMTVLLANTKDTYGRIIAESLLRRSEWGHKRRYGYDLFMVGMVPRATLVGVIKSETPKGSLMQKLVQVPRLLVVVFDHGGIEWFPL